MDTLQFYAFSANKKAGEGVGDIINDHSEYTKLNKITNWRRMFSSFWSEDPFVFEGNTYLSFEHAYQSSKYRINGYEEIAYKFTIESGDVISKQTGKDVQRAGRLVKLNKFEIALWDHEMRNIKNSIYNAKFTKTSRPGKALIATGNAILINAGPRIKRIRCTRLESLRARLLE